MEPDAPRCRKGAPRRLDPDRVPARRAGLHRTDRGGNRGPCDGLRTRSRARSLHRRGIRRGLQPRPPARAERDLRHDGHARGGTLPRAHHKSRRTRARHASDRRRPEGVLQGEARRTRRRRRAALQRRGHARTLQEDAGGRPAPGRRDGQDPRGAQDPGRRDARPGVPAPRPRVHRRARHAGRHDSLRH